MPYHHWTDREILALSFVRGLSAVHIRQLVDEFSSLGEIFGSALSPALAAKFSQQSLFSQLSRDSLLDEADRQIELCEKNSVRIIPIWSGEYPARLRDIHYPPALIFVRGELLPAGTEALGIVGTRKCTQYGRLTAERFAESFSANGIITCSGLAYGIDMAAHHAALKSGGSTYAVIASGIDQISPYHAAKLAREISGQGAVISEYRCGTRALPAYFPQRNRIISGISLATLVVESDVRGGALITAQFALDQNREVFAVPGNISSEKSAGTNMLIRKNMAIAALSPSDMLGELGLLKAGENPPVESAGLPDYEKKIYDAIGFEPLHVDILAEKVNSSVQEILVNLLSLEFRGLVRQLAGKNFIRLR